MRTSTSSRPYPQPPASRFATDRMPLRIALAFLLRDIGVAEVVQIAKPVATNDLFGDIDWVDDDDRVPQMITATIPALVEENTVFRNPARAP